MIIDGKKIAHDLLEELKEKYTQNPGPRPPKLAYLLIGDNPASHIYVRYKVKACSRIGFEACGHTLPKEVSEQEVLDLIESLNHDSTVDGILVQMPLPAHINAKKVIESVDPKKDVDGFHPFNMGRLLQGNDPYFIPCTPLGIQQLLIHSHIPIAGKHVVILGRSSIVGKPLAALLSQKSKDANATVTLAHSYTEHLEDITLSADILIAAMGVAEKVQGAMVKSGAIVIDVGINRLQGKLVGDVAFEEVAHKASFITPVPGGVGPMTIAMLLSNTYKSYQMRVLA